MPKLAVHAVASRVLESLFMTVSPKETAILKQEFYSPHFALFAADALQQPTKGDKKKNPIVPTLDSNLKLVPDKKDATLDCVPQLLNKGMEKTLYGFSYFQELFGVYVDVATPNEIRTMGSTAADHAVHLLSTRAGTKDAAALTAYCTVQQKRIENAS
jgi:hypothetical protein